MLLVFISLRCQLLVFSDGSCLSNVLSFLQNLMLGALVMANCLKPTLVLLITSFWIILFLDSVLLNAGHLVVANLWFTVALNFNQSSM